MIGSSVWYRPKPAPRLPTIRPLSIAPQLAAFEHPCDRWLDTLVDKYGLPRAAITRMLAARGAIEHEIGRHISARAWATAQRLLDDRETPEEGDGLWERAVAACYRDLRQRIIAESAARVREITL